jgi:ankyrin repeat protein
MSASRAIVGAVYRNDYPALNELLTSAYVDSRDKDGTTPLMHAILADPPYPEMIEYLLDHGADVNAADKAGWTPLHFAARDQNAIIVKILLGRGAVVDPVDDNGSTPLWQCINATYPPDPTVVDFLLAHGADPRRKHKFDYSPIDLARAKNNHELVERLERAAKSS